MRCRTPCLCAFDVDRTLTGYQELNSECPNNLVKDGVKDYAYLYATPRGFGFLTLSELAQGRHLKALYIYIRFIDFY